MSTIYLSREATQRLNELYSQAAGAAQAKAAVDAAARQAVARYEDAVAAVRAALGLPAGEVSLDFVAGTITLAEVDP